MLSATLRVSIIILNWNGWKDTIKCLESLNGILYPNYDVIVIDNGSKDGSVEEIRNFLRGQILLKSRCLEASEDSKACNVWECTREEAERGCRPFTDFYKRPSNKRIVLLKNDKNYGFAEGSNIGIRYALAVLEPEYILLLNNDTVVKDDFLDKLVKTMCSDEKVGFDGPMVLYYDYSGRKDIISTVGGEIIMHKGSVRLIGQGEIDHGQYDTARIVDYIEGSCLLIKKAALDKIGLLDSSYFLYWEETDLCFRGLEAGYKCVCVPTAKIWHKVSASISLVSKTYIYYMTRNKFWFIRSHAARKELCFFLIYFFIRQFPVNVGVYLKRKDPERLSAFLKGVLHGLLSKR